MTEAVVNNTVAKRFELGVEGIEGFIGKAWYRLSPGKITFTHTDVPKELAGKGVGTKLAKAALDHARAENLAVVPLCPFIWAYIRKNKEYADLVDPGFTPPV